MNSINYTQSHFGQRKIVIVPSLRLIRMYKIICTKSDGKAFKKQIQVSNQTGSLLMPPSLILGLKLGSFVTGGRGIWKAKDSDAFLPNTLFYLTRARSIFFVKLAVVNFALKLRHILWARMRAVIIFQHAKNLPLCLIIRSHWPGILS